MKRLVAWFEENTIVRSVVDVSHDVFQKMPMMFSRIVGEAGERGNSECNIRTCSKCKIEQLANEGSVGKVAHLQFAFLGFGTVFDGWYFIRGEWSIPFLVLGKEVANFFGVSLLGEEDGTIREVLESYSESILHFLIISDFETISKVIESLLSMFFVGTGDEEIVNIERYDGERIRVNVERWFNSTGSKSKILLEKGVDHHIPTSSSMRCAVEGLVEDHGVAIFAEFIAHEFIPVLG